MNSIEIDTNKNHMQNSPNIGERSSKLADTTLKVSFSLQFWVIRHGFASQLKKNY